MWNLLGSKKNYHQCSDLRTALEYAIDSSALTATQLAHLSACPDCQTAAEDFSACRMLLRHSPLLSVQPDSWFAPRVMAAIAARESEWRQSLETWAAVPRLAARLTWVSALALLLASTWLYQVPKSAPPPQSGSATVAESIFDSTQSSTAQDDVLPVENPQ